MLDSLNSIDWKNIRHSHGTAEQFPVWIRQLVSEDQEVRERAREDLFEFSHHQGSIYEVSAYIVPFFLELITHKDTPDKYLLLYHLSSLASCSSRWVVENSYGGNELVTYRNINMGLPLYLELLQDGDPEVRLEAFRTIVAVKDPDLFILKKIPSKKTVIRALIAALKSEMNPAVKAEMIGIFDAYSGEFRFETLREEYEDIRNLLHLLAKEDPNPLVKLNAMRVYLDLLGERPGEAQFMDYLLRDMLIDPEKYGGDASISVELTLKTAIDYTAYLPRITRLNILADALNKSRYPSDAHLITRALLDTIFFGFVRAEKYSFTTKPTETKMRLERRRLEAEDPAERPDNSHVSFRPRRFGNEQETRNFGWFYLSNQPPMDLNSLSTFERKLLEQALHTELAWMLHSNLLAAYGLPVSRAEALENLSKVTTKAGNGRTRS